tara:strand:+ start:666 stop:950 length:285 start_codon:yes stop_codon:yes gene_type:complete
MTFGPTSDKPTGGAGENIGKNVNVQVLSKTNITQAELDSVIAQLKETTTIIAIGPFTAGATDVLGIITEGPEVADDGSNAFGITGATWASTTGF